MRIKKKKKKDQHVIHYTLLIIGIIVILSLILLILSLTKNRDNKFKIEDRTQEIKNEQKKDNGTYETIAWVRVEGTNIDYPVIIDITEKYTNPVEKEAYGWLNSDTKKYTNNLTVDGHNIFNLGVPKKSAKNFVRFEELMSFVYYDFAKENQFIQLTMDGNNYLYQIFAVSFMYDLDFSLLPAEKVNKKEQQETIDFIKKQSIYKYNIEVSSNDKILNVATCTRLFGKNNRTNFVVSAKLVDNKVLKLNSVKKTKKYKKVDKKMKGSEENDKNKEPESA